MIDLKDAYKKVTAGGQEYLTFDFKCECCEQEYGPESLDIAVFLYGVFFLVGKDHGYVGMTCPNCMSTMLLRGKRELVDSTKLSLSTLIFLAKTELIPDLRYFSPVTFSLEGAAQLKGLDILHWNTPLPTHEAANVKAALRQYADEVSEWGQEYLCSYASVEDPPMGAFLSAQWFKEKDVATLLSIEQDEKIRVFPRYVHYNSVFEAVERFCWKNYACHVYLQRQRIEMERSFDELKKLAEERGADFGKILEANPGVANSESLDWFHFKEPEFSIPADFMNILAADPFPWGSDDEVGRLCKGFWTTEFPFRDRDVPRSLVDFDAAIYDRTDTEKVHSERVNAIQERFHMNYVQSFLLERHQDFIRDYMKIARRPDSSYATLRELRESYLRQLYDLTKSKQKMRANQRHREECRVVAERLWKKDPTITIADMALRDEINEIFINERKEPYREDTIRNWIKDLCPNRQPGRRPKKPKT